MRRSTGSVKVEWKLRIEIVWKMVVLEAELQGLRRERHRSGWSRLKDHLKCWIGPMARRNPLTSEVLEMLEDRYDEQHYLGLGRGLYGRRAFLAGSRCMVR